MFQLITQSKCFLYYIKKSDKELLEMLKSEIEFPSDYVFVMRNILYNRRSVSLENNSDQYQTIDFYKNNIKEHKITLGRDYHCKKCQEIIDSYFKEYCPKCGVDDPFYFHETLRDFKKHSIFSKLAWFFTIVWGFLMLGLVFNINNPKSSIEPIYAIILSVSALLGVVFHSIAKTLINRINFKQYNQYAKK